MPGVIMDNANVEGFARRPELNEMPNGTSGSFGNNERGQPASSISGPVQTNGTGKDIVAVNQRSTTQNSNFAEYVASHFELPHITQGFFPLGTLVNRAVQQCWNELSELMTEVAAIHVPSDASSATMANSKLAGNQSSENVHKKLRVLDFIHSKRAEFIKLLVLSQWSRQAEEVGRLIDVQGFIRARHQAYSAAVQSVGEMKRDLVRAQVANPDLRTALEVLSSGQVAALPDLGYRRPKRLTARVALRTLRKINRIIGIRLAVHDQVPAPLRKYYIHDGRVTFIVPGEFELDLAVAEEAHSSQFFFVDIRFLFSPSSPIPKGRIFDELDAKVNEILCNDGLMRCFDFLHGLVLTNKVNTLFRQAADLARGQWSDALRIELLHRTLVVQYWQSRTGSKSWLEIGIQKAQRGNSTTDTRNQVPHLALRWMRDGQQAKSDAIQFNPDTLAIERTLRSVIALHTSHLLSTAYASLRKNLLYSNRVLSLGAQLSSEEPGDCYLDVQLTRSRHLRVSVEPLSGAITLSGTSSVLERFDGDRRPSQSADEELLSRVTRLRCITAVDEIECGTKTLGLEGVNQRSLGIDVRRMFPSNVLRSVFFTHQFWGHRWVAAATSSMDGDSWWLVQLWPVDKISRATGLYAANHGITSSPSPHSVSSILMSPQQRPSYTAYAELVHGLTGILAIYSNAQCLAELPDTRFYPPLEKLQLGAQFEIPDLFIRYKASMLPVPLRIALPTGLGGGSYLQDTIRLSYHGVDRQSQSTVLMAYGTLRFRIKSLLPLVSKMDPSLLMQEGGGGFALRMVVPAGHPVIFCLFARLQQLDCVLSILQSLLRRGMTPRSLSLTQASFSYGPDARFAGQFSIDVSGPSLSEHVDISQALSKNDALFELRLRLSFESPSPHRRLSESLTVALNQRFASTGVDSILGIVSYTFPVLHCFDQITSKQAQSGSFVVNLTVRAPAVYLIHYPHLKMRFQLSVRSRKGQPTWVLENTSPRNQGQVAAEVKKKIYQSRGEGWQGLGDGAMASADNIGHLLLELHDCLSSYQPVPERGEGNPPVQSGTSRGPQAGLSGAAANPTNVPSQQAGVVRSADVITID